MPRCAVPFDLWFFCRVISPWTNEEETRLLRETARDGWVNWERVAVLANRANLAPALRAGLRARGLWPDAPEVLRVYLDEIYRFNERRNNLLRRELVEVVGCLNDAGIVPMPLKGGGALAGGLFADPAVRFMWDLDVLVPAEKVEHSVCTLEKAGWFVPAKYLGESANREAFYRAKHFLPLVREGGTASVEVHRMVVSDEWQTLLNTEEVWAESLLFGSSLLPGVSLALMSPTHQVLHGFIHSQLAHGNHRAHRLDLRQLHHFAHLCLSFRDTADWDRIAVLAKSDRVGRAFRTYLHLAGEFFGVETPVGQMRDACTESYLRRVFFFSRRRMKAVWVIKEILVLLGGCLGERRLRMCDPAKAGSPGIRRRFHRLGRLLAKYSRWGEWKRVIRETSQRHDSLG